MAGFCVSCGAALSGTFCNKCGARAISAGAPAPTSAPAPVVAPPVASTSSGLGKVLLWVGGILLLLVVIGTAAAMYGVYWVKHKVAAYSSAVTGNSGATMKVVQHGKSCQLLSTAELQQFLGVTVEKSEEIVENDTPGCAYYTSPGAFKELQKMAAEQARKQSDEVNSRPGPKRDNFAALLKNANEMEGMIKTLGLTQTPEDGKVFSFVVDTTHGQDRWSAERLIEKTVPGFEEIQGVGDHAMFGAFGHALYVLKGDTIIQLDTLWVPDAHTRGAQIANKIVSKL